MTGKDPRYHVSINDVKPPPPHKWIWLEPAHQYHPAVYAFVSEHETGWHGWREGVDQKSFPSTVWLKGMWRECERPKHEPPR
jgi:hypothetical protein